MCLKIVTKSQARNKFLDVKEVDNDVYFIGLKEFYYSDGYLFSLYHNPGEMYKLETTKLGFEALEAETEQGAIVENTIRVRLPKRKTYRVTSITNCFGYIKGGYHIYFLDKNLKYRQCKFTDFRVTVPVLVKMNWLQYVGRVTFIAEKFIIPKIELFPDKDLKAAYQAFLANLRYL